MTFLVLYWDDWHRPLRLAVRDHLFSFSRYGDGNRFFYFNVKFGLPASVRGLSVDAIILHNTFLALRWHPDRRKLAAFTSPLAEMKAAKIALPQDEYDCAHTLDDFLCDIGTGLVGTNFPEAVDRLYPKLSRRARFLKVLTGYVQEDTVKTLPLDRRPLDVVYRASRLPYWFGRHGQRKAEVGHEAKRAAQKLGLLVDISVDAKDVLAGDSWFRFLASGRAVVGCEGGSSLIDPRGEIQRAVRACREPLTFDEAERRFFPGQETLLAALSPRHLEGAVTRNVQILAEGQYSGVLEPHRHYIPFGRDIGEALEKLSDRKLCERLVADAYEDLVASGKYGYRQFVRTIVDAAETLVAKPHVVRRAPSWRYTLTCLSLDPLRRGLSPLYRLGAWIADRRDVLPARALMGLRETIQKRLQKV